MSQPHAALTKCPRCGGRITWKPIKQNGIRKPALRGKRTCDDCGYWPLTDVVQSHPNEMLHR